MREFTIELIPGSDEDVEEYFTQLKDQERLIIDAGEMQFVDKSALVKLMELIPTLPNTVQNIIIEHNFNVVDTVSQHPFFGGNEALTQNRERLYALVECCVKHFRSLGQLGQNPMDNVEMRCPRTGNVMTSSYILGQNHWAPDECLVDDELSFLP